MPEQREGEPLLRNTSTSNPDAEAGAEELTSAAASATDVFGHGVASGDPLPHGVLIWTRVTPDADARPGSGVGPEVAVGWEVATDAAFDVTIASGTVTTGPGRDHTVKVAVDGLVPDTSYWYRFTIDGSKSDAAATVSPIASPIASPIGVTHTAPAAQARVELLRFGVVSCANWQAGYFSAYRHLAERGDLDLMLHLGDYLYEYGPGEFQARDVVVRPHDPPAEALTLSDYRRRHAQYKTDPDLQSLHARVPFVTTWDDHESANDAWSGGAGNHTEGAEGAWTDRRAASQQAYSEWMPVRYEPGGQLYRRFRYGSLATLSMLDLRSYRSKQVSSVLDAEINDPERSITGEAQMKFLLDGLAADTVWKLVGNPVMITPVRIPGSLRAEQAVAMHALLGSDTPVADTTGKSPARQSAVLTASNGAPYNVDQWDGYSADQRTVIDFLASHSVTGAVFLTGDIHSGWACELPVDSATYPETAASVAVEFVCASVTSDNLDDFLRVPPRTVSRAIEAAFKAANSHVKYVDADSHGYCVLEITAASMRMDWFVLADRTDPLSASDLSTSWRVAAGSNAVQAVDQR